MNATNPKADFYFQKSEKWLAELTQLRRLILDCGCPLTEEVKWGVPCYTSETRNIVLIHVFKDYCAMLFFKGALLPDPHGILVQQTQNVQSGRQVRFTDVRQIMELEPTLKATIHEAIDIEKSGRKVERPGPADLVFPDEFQAKLDTDPALKTAFDALTPGRRRAYNLYFSAAKQPKTREARVEKSILKILAGKGLDDE